MSIKYCLISNYNIESANIDKSKNENFSVL